MEGVTALHMKYDVSLTQLWDLIQDLVVGIQSYISSIVFQSECAIGGLYNENWYAIESS